MKFKLLRLSPHFWFRTHDNSAPDRLPSSFTLRRSTSLKLVKSSSPSAPPPLPPSDIDHPIPSNVRPLNVRRVCTVVDAGCACRATVTSSSSSSSAREKPFQKTNLSPAAAERAAPKAATVPEEVKKQAALLEWTLPRNSNAASEDGNSTENKNGSCRRKKKKAVLSPPLASDGALTFNSQLAAAAHDRDLVVLDTDARSTRESAYGWPPRISSSSSGGDACNRNSNRALMVAEACGGRSFRFGGREEDDRGDDGRMGRRQPWPWPPEAVEGGICGDDSNSMYAVVEANDELERGATGMEKAMMAGCRSGTGTRRRSVSLAEDERKMEEEGQIQVMIRRRRRRRRRRGVGGGGGRLKEEEEEEEAGAVAMAKRSVDPRGDFKKSMEEMVEAKGLGGQGQLQELLQCYLCLNPRRYHGAIVSAFHDLLDSRSPPTPAPAPLLSSHL